MYDYDKEHWKETLYDAIEFDEMDEDESDGLEEACNDMIEAAIDVLIENGLYTSKLNYFKTLAEIHAESAPEEHKA